MRNKTIIERTPPEQNPRVDFELGRFETLVYTKGVDIIHESAIACPCKEKGGEHNSSCRNCLGTGWVFVNPVKTKMVVQNLNLNVKNNQWSEERRGTMAVTARFIDKLNFMDKITDLNSESLFSQILYPFTYQEKLLAYTTYDVETIDCMFLYNGAEQKLLKLEQDTDFTFQDNIITLADKYKNYEFLTLSIFYRHKIMYYIIDLSRETRNNVAIENSGKEGEIKLPVSGVARRAHYVLDAENYAGTLIFDNSF